MKHLIRKLNLFSSDSLQDVIFLVGIFLFITILIIVLFPGRDAGTVVTREFFIYTVMTVPVIAALYFIVMSFQKNLYTDGEEVGSSIRKKMAVAFIFVAVLPSLPIIITSHYLLNKTLSDLIFDKTSVALQNAIGLSGESLTMMHDSMNGELATLGQELQQGNYPGAPAGRERLRALHRPRGYYLFFYQFEPGPLENTVKPLEQGASDLHQGLVDFYHYASFWTEARIDRLSIGRRDFICGALRWRTFLVVVSRPVPASVAKNIAFYTQALADHRRLVVLMNNFTSNAGLYLFAISVVVILISVTVSLYLSKNIVRPVLELTDAAKKITTGDFSVSLTRDSDDELAMLYNSFNRMVRELDRNRKVMYQKQRLEAWREMARRVVHEIKNPLTPIRLSAERMKKRYLERHPNLDEIIVTGADTIVEEVKVLTSILSEFTKFARLPEMNPVKTAINPLVENCVHIFSAHERITFVVELDDRAPEIFIDRVLIRQTLTNLLQNAVEAIEGTGTITVKTEFLPAGAGTVAILIRDTGAGIKKRDLERIFAPGFSTKATGTGLGLAIVEKIIMEHGGEIACTSVPGKGTDFVIQLPIGPKEE